MVLVLFHLSVASFPAVMFDLICDWRQSIWATVWAALSAFVGGLDCCLTAGRACWLDGWPAGVVARWLALWRAAWLAGWLAVWLAGCLAGLRAGCLAGGSTPVP